jgi:hypothetical protein
MREKVQHLSPTGVFNEQILNNHNQDSSLNRIMILEGFNPLHLEHQPLVAASASDNTSLESISLDHVDQSCCSRLSPRYLRSEPQLERLSPCFGFVNNLFSDAPKFSIRSNFCDKMIPKCIGSGI